MSEPQSSAVELLRGELSQEAIAGFPRLKRIPSTDIIWFLDYFSTLPPAEQDQLLEGMASTIAMMLAAPRGPAPENAAVARMRASRSGPGGKGGTRYTDVKTLSMEPAFRDPAGYHESWRQKFTPLHFQPRTDLLPDLSHLSTAKASLRRKLVKAALKGLGLKPEKGRYGGEPHYVGPFGSSELNVWLDFGSMLGQLSYGVSLKNPAFKLLVFRWTYEQFWGGGSWDYMTEENVGRCVEFFAEQVVYLAKFGERLNEMAS
jgi:hypothetical protein